VKPRNNPVLFFLSTFYLKIKQLQAKKERMKERCLIISFFADYERSVWGELGKYPFERMPQEAQANASRGAGECLRRRKRMPQEAQGNQL
jgi:hypothetical protein